uniref:Retrovirus-related Pol polyprotein from transposon TNT 1-94 n=1 Tax=Tanacetum cinerariifolium TaxID=118510 RepID=A0A6L2J639_TANCI|nr:retrovirus-related Pol polyprotein from transposon TNT 1-94 [Tanacetum cinerariifolium]
MVNAMLSYSGLSDGVWGEDMLMNYYLLNKGCRAVVRLSNPKRKTLGEKESKDAIFDENGFSSIPRTKDIIPNPDESQKDDHSNDVPSETLKPHKDVKTTFLNGNFEEEVYMKQPKGFVMLGNEHKVCKLVKSLYGLKQAPKQWHQKFDEDAGEADVILGIKIKHKNKGIVITQSYYIEKLLKKFNRKDYSSVSTPMDPVEKLMPNTVGRLSRFTSNPSRQHWHAIRRVFKYLKGTMNYGLSYVGYLSLLEGYSDVKWINHVEDSSSTSKWVFLLRGDQQVMVRLKNIFLMVLLKKLQMQDFQDSPDDDEDTRSSHEYLNDLKEEYQARALLAKSKDSSRKNKVLIAKAYEWDEEEVSSNDNEIVEVKVLMALAKENDAVSKEGAIHGEWLKISMRKVHSLLKIEDNDDRKVCLDYLCIDLNYVEEPRSNLLSKHRNLVHELNACNEQLLVLKQAKLDFLTMQHVNTKILKENKNLRTELKELKAVTKTWLNSSNKVNQCISEQILSQNKRILGVDQLAEDPSSSGIKDLVFVKSSADDTKVTIPGVKRPWLSEAEGFILPNHDTDESSVCSILLPLLKKLDGAEPISGPKTIKLILRSKSTFKAEALKDVTINELSLAPAKVQRQLSNFGAVAGELVSVCTRVDQDEEIASRKERVPETYDYRSQYDAYEYDTYHANYNIEMEDDTMYRGEFGDQYFHPSSYETPSLFNQPQRPTQEYYCQGQKQSDNQHFSSDEKYDKLMSMIESSKEANQRYVASFAAHDASFVALETHDKEDVDDHNNSFEDLISPIKEHDKESVPFKVWEEVMEANTTPYLPTLKEPILSPIDDIRSKEDEEFLALSLYEDKVVINQVGVDDSVFENEKEQDNVSLVKDEHHVVERCYENSFNKLTHIIVKQVHRKARVGVRNLSQFMLKISLWVTYWSKLQDPTMITRIISLERRINPRNSQHAFKKYKACGSPNQTTTDHYDIEWFKKGESLKAKKVEALKSTRAKSSNANRSKTPTKSGCSRHMTGVKSYLHKYMEQPGPKVVFGDDSTCTTEGYGFIKCNGIVFLKVVFIVNGIKYNLISISQLCDAKYIVQFDEKRGTIFNSNKEIVMIAPRVRDVYVLDMTSSAQESCFFAKAYENLSWLWHKRLAHLNFKTINKLAKQNLVIGLPSLVYSKDKPCSSCEKGKNHRANFKTKQTSSIKKCLHLLHTDLFGPKKSQAPETVENQNDIKVKQLRTDNGTKFRNSTLVNFCVEKGISHNFSSPYTPEQNGVTERKNRTLIEAARTMLSGSVFSKQYWTEAIATACYTQNRSTIMKRHLKTPYEIFHKRIPNISFLHVFGCPVYIHNHKDHLGKFDKKADDGYLLGYSLVSKTFRVFNTRRQQTEETYHITFDESPEDIKFSKPSVDNINFAESERYPPDKYVHPYKPSQRNASRAMAKQLSVASVHECLFVDFLSEEEPKKVSEALKHPGWVFAMQDELNQFARNKVWTLVPAPYGKTIIGSRWIFRNKRDETKIVIKNKARLVAQGYNQQECIDYDETFAPVTILEAIRIFLAFATYMNFIVYQMDVISALLNGKLKEEVYVKQPPSFESNEFPNHVCKLDKALYGLKQAPRACLGLWYPKCSGFDLKGYSDSDYASCNMDRKITSAKAEHIAAVGCCANILWMKSQLTNYDIIYEKVFSVHNWILKPNQPKEPPFTDHMKAICNLDAHVDSKAPKYSSPTKEVHLLQSQKKELEQVKVIAEAEVASIKAKPLYPDINQLTKLLVAELKNIQWELPAEFLNLPHLASSVQEKLKTLDSLPGLLKMVTNTLNRFATLVENASGATTTCVPLADKATALPVEGEKDVDTNLKMN